MRPLDYLVAAVENSTVYSFFRVLLRREGSDVVGEQCVRLVSSNGRNAIFHGIFLHADIVEMSANSDHSPANCKVKCCRQCRGGCCTFTKVLVGVPSSE